MKEYHTLYRTTNLINGKIYVGVHTTKKIDDGYLGSGRALRGAIKKYGKENFSREIIGFFQTREDSLLEERVVVNKKFVFDQSNYNLTIGGGSGEGGKPLIGRKVSDETRKKISEANKGRVHTEECKARMSESRKGKGKGASNCNHKGTYVTPMGNFNSASEAAVACGVSRMTLFNRCKGYNYSYTPKRGRYKVIKSVEGWSFTPK